MAFRKLSAEECRLIHMWKNEDGKGPAEIAGLLHRNKSTVTRFLKKGRKAQGRPPALTSAQVDRLEAKLKELIKKADRKQIVTLKQLKLKSKCKASERTISRALHARQIYFRPLRSKPSLTPEDIAARTQFAADYKAKTRGWWLRHVHLHIDCKVFPVLLSGKARAQAAMSATRGAYRRRGQGLDFPYVRPGKASQSKYGGRGVTVLAGLGGGKVLVWKYVVGRNWSGTVASEMYRGPVKRALQKQYPSCRKWRVLEDNDPSGFQSTKGVQAKADSHIEPFRIPKRSPQLNVCDFALWKEVNKRMRKQEATWKPSKRETRSEYLGRLRRTALRLPASFVNASISDMRRRCQRLHAVRGGHFEEGGRDQD